MSITKICLDDIPNASNCSNPTILVVENWELKKCSWFSWSWSWWWSWCNLDSILAGSILNWVVVWNLTGTYVCPTTGARYFSQTTAPVSANDWDYWNDISTLDPVMSYIRQWGSWIHTWFGNLDADLTPGSVRDWTNIYWVLGTHQTTISQVLNDAWTPDSQVFGIAWSLTMNLAWWSQAEITPYTAWFWSKVAFIWVYKHWDAVIPMVQMLDTSTATPTWMWFKRPQKYISNTPWFSSVYSVKQLWSIIKFIFSQYIWPNYSHRVLEFDMNTNSFQSTSQLIWWQIGWWDLIQSISNTTVSWTYNLNLPTMDMSPLFINSDNDYTAPAVTWTVLWNTPISLIGNNYFTKVSCFSMAHGWWYEASVANVFAAAI